MKDLKKICIQCGFDSVEDFCSEWGWKHTRSAYIKGDKNPEQLKIILFGTVLNRAQKKGLKPVQIGYMVEAMFEVMRKEGLIKDEAL